jgi:hypothetical protein
MSQSPSLDPEKPSQDVAAETKQEAPDEYPSNQKRIVVMMALFLSMFLVTLVRIFYFPFGLY